jgi:hypothetical protein
MDEAESHCRCSSDNANSPQTSILGTILLTGYLGGANASQVRIAGPFWFPIVFGVFVWTALFLRDGRLRRLVPLRRPSANE